MEKIDLKNPDIEDEFEIEIHSTNDPTESNDVFFGKVSIRDKQRIAKCVEVLKDETVDLGYVAHIIIGSSDFEVKPHNEDQFTTICDCSYYIIHKGSVMLRCTGKYDASVVYESDTIPIDI